MPGRKIASVFRLLEDALEAEFDMIDNEDTMTTNEETPEDIELLWILDSDAIEDAGDEE